MWLNSNRPNFVDYNPDDLSPDVVTGCTTLFRCYLHDQPEFGVNQIIAAGAGSLAGGVPQPDGSHRRVGRVPPARPRARRGWTTLRFQRRSLSRPLRCPSPSTSPPPPSPVRSSRAPLGCTPSTPGPPCPPPSRASRPGSERCIQAARSATGTVFLTRAGRRGDRQPVQRGTRVRHGSGERDDRREPAIGHLPDFRGRQHEAVPDRHSEIQAAEAGSAPTAVLIITPPRSPASWPA